MRKGREFPVPHPASVLYPVPFPPVESVKLRSLKSRPSEGYHVNSKRWPQAVSPRQGRARQGRARQRKECGSSEVLNLS